MSLPKMIEYKRGAHTRNAVHACQLKEVRCGTRWENPQTISAKPIHQPHSIVSPQHHLVLLATTTTTANNNSNRIRIIIIIVTNRVAFAKVCQCRRSRRMEAQALGEAGRTMHAALALSIAGPLASLCGWLAQARENTNLSGPL